MLLAQVLYTGVQNVLTTSLGTCPASTCSYSPLVWEHVLLVHVAPVQVGYKNGNWSSWCGNEVMKVLVIIIVHLCEWPDEYAAIFKWKCVWERGRQKRYRCMIRSIGITILTEIPHLDSPWQLVIPLWNGVHLYFSVHPSNQDGSQWLVWTEWDVLLDQPSSFFAQIVLSTDGVYLLSVVITLQSQD